MARNKNRKNKNRKNNNTTVQANLVAAPPAPVQAPIAPKPKPAPAVKPEPKPAAPAAKEEVVTQVEAKPEVKASPAEKIVLTAALLLTMAKDKVRELVMKEKDSYVPGGWSRQKMVDFWQGKVAAAKGKEQSAYQKKRYKEVMGINPGQNWDALKIHSCRDNKVVPIGKAAKAEIVAMYERTLGVTPTESWSGQKTWENAQKGIKPGNSGGGGGPRSGKSDKITSKFLSELLTYHGIAGRSKATKREAKLALLKQHNIDPNQWVMEVKVTFTKKEAANGKA